MVIYPVLRVVMTGELGRRLLRGIHVGDSALRKNMRTGKPNQKPMMGRYGSMRLSSQGGAAAMTGGSKLESKQRPMTGSGVCQLEHCSHDGCEREHPGSSRCPYEAKRQKMKLLFTGFGVDNCEI